MPTYIESQLEQLGDADHHYLLQIKSDKGGSTKWLNVSPEQLKAIAAVLNQPFLDAELAGYDEERDNELWEQEQAQVRRAERGHQ